MQTIVVLLNPGKLENPDMDLRYCIPDRIEEVSKGAIQDNGYDFVDTEDGQPGPLMGIWLKTESASENWPLIKKCFKMKNSKEMICLLRQKYTFQNMILMRRKIAL